MNSLYKISVILFFILLFIGMFAEVGSFTFSVILLMLFIYMYNIFSISIVFEKQNKVIKDMNNLVNCHQKELIRLNKNMSRIVDLLKGSMNYEKSIIVCSDNNNDNNADQQ